MIYYPQEVSIHNIILKFFDAVLLIFAIKLNITIRVNMSLAARLKNRIEEVYLRDKELVRQIVTDNPKQNTSIEAIKREYKFISTVKDIDIYIKSENYNKGSYVFRGYTKKIIEGNRRELVFTLIFKHKPTIDISNVCDKKRIFQVNLVESSKDVEELGLASSVYKYLTTQNCAIISDNNQYAGGKYLWKKLSQDSNFRVKIYDERYKKYFTDKNKEVSIYNGTNVSDELIWDLDMNSEVSKNVILVLESK